MKIDAVDSRCILKSHMNLLTLLKFLVGTKALSYSFATFQGIAFLSNKETALGTGFQNRRALLENSLPLLAA